MSEQQKEELERILKEIGAKYSFIGETLYFKYKTYKSPQEWSLELYSKYMREIIFNPRLEYAVYVDFVHSLMPAYSCIETEQRFSLDVYRDIIEQFIPYIGNRPLVNEKFVENVIGIEPLTDSKDPLSQIFAYRRMILARSLQHVYICPRVNHVDPPTDPNVPDSASIFHGKEGIIAYCMTFYDFFNIELLYGNKEVADRLFGLLENVRSIATEKITNQIGKLRELWNQDRVKACDVNLIKEIIHEEIEKANEIIRKYGIIRVAIPLS